MKTILLTLATMGLLLNCSACSAKDKRIDNSPVAEFDLQRFLGTWYEIARYDHFFEKNMQYAQARYTLNEDGTINVKNSGVRKGKYKESNGTAKCPDPENEPAMLRVSFFLPFYSDYRIMMIDPFYRFALIGSKGPNYLWILSRERELPSEIVEEILMEASARGYDTSKLIWVKQ